MSEELKGGIANAGRVVREGNVVLRPAPPNARTIHALLQHVTSRGFPGHKPLEIRDDGLEAVVFIPGKDPVGHHPGMRGPEQSARSKVVVPCHLIQPAHQTPMCGLAGELDIAIALPDLRGMSPPNRQLAVADQHTGIINVELASQRHDHRFRYRRGVGQEHSDSSNRCQLCGKPEPSGVAGTSIHQIDIGLTRMAPPAIKSTPTTLSDSHHSGIPPANPQPMRSDPSERVPEPILIQDPAPIILRPLRNPHGYRQYSRT